MRGHTPPLCPSSKTMRARKRNAPLVADDLNELTILSTPPPDAVAGPLATFALTFNPRSTLSSFKSCCCELTTEYVTLLLTPAGLTLRPLTQMLRPASFSRKSPEAEL